MRIETLTDITSPWLSEAVKKQKILLIFNTSYHVPIMQGLESSPNYIIFGKQISNLDNYCCAGYRILDSSQPGTETKESLSFM